MAVVPRKRRGGVITYYVATSWEGGQHWERVGHNKREAEQVNRDRLKQVKDGSFKPGRLTDAASVESYAKAWLKTRTNRARDNDEQLLTDHVLSVRSFADLRIGDVRPRHVLQLITDIRAAGKLAEKTIALALGLVRVMFRDAVIDETIQATPYVVPRGKLTRAGKTRSPYTPAEVAKLTSDLVPERDRVWATLALLTGCRCGEVCGLTWGDLNGDPEPLNSLTVERQYDGAVTKTGRARVVPVHPILRGALDSWLARWSLHFLRHPTLTDPIVPALDGTPMTKSSAYKGWRRACKAAGVTNRTVHSTRHTFITLTRRGGADISIVERITHNPKGTIIDVYNHRDWADFCAAVMCLKVGQETPGPSGPTAPSDASTGPGEGLSAVVPCGGESGALSQPLDVDTREPLFGGSSSRTRTVVTTAPYVDSWGGQEQRELIEHLREAGLLGVRERLGARQDYPGAARNKAGGELRIGDDNPFETPRGTGYSRAALSLFAEACSLGVA
jgi:integrase